MGSIIRVTQRLSRKVHTENRNIYKKRNEEGKSDDFYTSSLWIRFLTIIFSVFNSWVVSTIYMVRWWRQSVHHRWMVSCIISCIDVGLRLRQRLTYLKVGRSVDENVYISTVIKIWL